jgi:Flp pilus assembly protein TadD
MRTDVVAALQELEPSLPKDLKAQAAALQRLLSGHESSKTVAEPPPVVHEILDSQAAECPPESLAECSTCSTPPSSVVDFAEEHPGEGSDDDDEVPLLPPKPGVPPCETTGNGAAGVAHAPAVEDVLGAPVGRQKTFSSKPARPAPEPVPTAAQPWYHGFLENSVLLYGTLISLALLAAALVGYWEDTRRARTSAMQRAAQGPQVWLDAVTRRQITPAFLLADKEYRMGEIFRLKRQFPQALGFYQEALRHDSTHLEAHDRLGYCLFKTDSLVAAEQAFKKAIALDRTFFRPHFYLGRIYFQQQRWEEAREAYARAFAAKPDLPIVGMEYVDVLLQLGLFPEARAVLEDLRQRFPSDVEFLNRRARLDEAQAGG